MKLKVYTGYTTPLGTIESKEGSKVEVVASKKHNQEFIEGLAVHSARYLSEQDDGNMPPSEDILKDMLRRMADGKSTWCEEMK